MSGTSPSGTITRGTTNPNRLRRFDRWIVNQMGAHLRRDPAAVVVDLGYGASPVTTLELAERLARGTGRRVGVVGLEIDPERVAAAASLARPGIDFRLGGFEVPLPAGRRPTVIRAANVLRQYPEADVADAWATMARRLAPDGLLMEGTCDELGRLAAWVAIPAPDGSSTSSAVPRSLTLSLDVCRVERPSAVAPRLPKALIHRNVPGERVHDLLAALDAAWFRSAPTGVFGARQRWLATVAAVRDAGWPLLDGPGRWRLGEVTVGWAAVAPAA